MHRRLLVGGFALVIALLITGCTIEERATTSIAGTTPASDIPGGADPADVEVIESWVTTLARGDIEGAASFFALPSVAENGPLLLHIETTEDARRFNASLPCGAELIRAVPKGDLTTATFRLKERPGGQCDAPGARAKTTFLIEDGEIVEWRREPTATAPPLEGSEV